MKWAATDQVSVFPKSWATPAMGTLTAAASETGSTTLTGASDFSGAYVKSIAFFLE